MSDSDDTDLLLLIPPDFFLINISQDEESPEDIICCNTCCSPSIRGEFPYQQQPSMSSHYHLPHNQQTELDNINARISQIEKNFSTESEISSISNTTVRSRVNSNQQQSLSSGMDCKSDAYNQKIRRNCPSPIKLIHSTPKVSELTNISSVSNISSCISKPVEHNNNGVISEIDQFFDNKRTTNIWNSNNDYQFRNTIMEPSSLPNSNNILQKGRFAIENSSRLSDWSAQKECNPLISLSEIWENNDVRYNDRISIQEERLRRQHCEKTIQALQSKLLEYQQKISVAIQVDKSKDNALIKLQDDNSSLQSEVKKYEQKYENLEQQKEEYVNKLKVTIEDLKMSKECLEKEMSQALSLASKFQDKNEILEIKVDSLSKATNDIASVYKTQIDDLEIKVCNSQRAEEIANEEQHKLKDLLARSQIDLEKALNQSAQFKNQLETLQNERQVSVAKIRHEKHRVESLDKQNRNLSESVTELSCKEKNLLRELETQRNTLKSHYQQQLEKVVEQKLKEFQLQLDTVETNLSREGKERERLIAERAIKQLEMINEKNEQEISLLIEKHNEEVELYRLQLINATKKISELDGKLNLYRNRRVDIAEKLHTVMETQWQKALEILTSPSNPINSKETINIKQLDPEKLDSKQKQEAENEEFDTPTSSKFKTYRTSDRLQAYIEMLLSKSPRDLDKLDDILAMPKNNSPDKRIDKSRQTNYSKPPWK